MNGLLELVLMFKRKRKLWLLPLVFVLMVLGLIVVLASTTVIGPFIYTIF